MNPETNEATPASVAMHARDDVAQRLGFVIERATPGAARVSVTVTEAMTNGLGTCHGGIVFSLADAVMGHASNAGNERSLATSASIEWVRAAYVGDRLTATGALVATRGRNTVFDVEVRNDAGETVAIFRGQTLTLGGSVIDADGAGADE